MAVVGISILALVAGAVSADPQSASANGSRGSLVVFGDSVSDNGSTPNYSGGIGYFNGRYSNSYVWNEYTAKLLDLKLENWAMSGATTDNSFVAAQFGNRLVPSIKETVAEYIYNNTNTPLAVKRRCVVAINGGNNDILLSSSRIKAGQINIPAFIQTIAENQLETVGALLDAGYTTIYVFNLVNLTLVPLVLWLGLRSMSDAFTTGINTGILDGLERLYSARGASSYGVRFFDLGGMMNLLVQRASLQAMNVSDFSNPCFTYNANGSYSTCTDADTRYFYDSAHMSGRPHYMIGLLFAKIVTDPSFSPSTGSVLPLARQYDVAHSDQFHNIVSSSG
ncbi:hypothetical protein GQ54DRAFT_325157 [Martensiomyces pterosporus]|nr:hypothetical protein GQ54DRAFT_325157 [Martensiomyces pterosporus]